MFILVFFAAFGSLLGAHYYQKHFIQPVYERRRIRWDIAQKKANYFTGNYTDLYGDRIELKRGVRKVIHDAASDQSTLLITRPRPVSVDPFITPLEYSKLRDLSYHELKFKLFEEPFLPFSPDFLDLGSFGYLVI